MRAAASALSDTLAVKKGGVPGWWGRRHCPPGHWKKGWRIAENPAVAVVVDHYDEDWTRLGWVMLHRRAELLAAGTEHFAAHALLRSSYWQPEATRMAPHAA